MKHYRFDVTDEVRKIEADAWENARALGFTTLAQIEQEMKRLERISYVRLKKLGQWERCEALWDINRALSFCQRFEAQVGGLLDTGRGYNLRAREAVAKIAARENETRGAKAA